MNKQSALVKQYNWFIVLLPILTIYKSPIPGIDLGVFISLYFALVLGSRSGLRFKLEGSFLTLIIYVLFSTGFTLFFTHATSYVMILFRMGKFVFFIFLILMLCRSKLFNSEYAIKSLRIVTLTAVTFIFLQYIAVNVFHVVIPNVIMSLISRGEELYSYLDYYAIDRLYLFRPTSFFLEPSHFALYVLPYLVYSLFGYNKTKLLEGLFVSAGLILSTSGIGIVLSIIIWTIYLIPKTILYVKKRNIFMPLIIIISVLVSMYMLLQLDLFNKAIGRIINPDAYGGNAIIGRMTGYTAYLDLPMINKIIGVGYGNVIPGEYFSSFAYTLYCNGIIGALLMLNIFFIAYKRGSRFQKVLCLVIFISTIGDTTFTAVSIVFYFSFILNNNKTKIQASTSFYAQKSVNIRS